MAETGFTFPFLHCNPLTPASALRRVLRNDSLKFSGALKLNRVSFDGDLIESRLETSRSLGWVTRAGSPSGWI